MSGLDPKSKHAIDIMTYEQLLRLWRFGSSSDALLQGETGKYFGEVMVAKRNAIGAAEAVRISKMIGW